MLAVFTGAGETRAVEAGNWERFKADVSFKAYLRGLATGWEMANESLEAKKLPRFFCLPASVAMSADDYVAMLESELQMNASQQPVDPNEPVESVLFRAMQETYPCRR